MPNRSTGLIVFVKKCMKFNSELCEFQCGSSQMASFEMLHKQGTSSGNLSGMTVGGDIGFTKARFDSQTAPFYY